MSYRHHPILTAATDGLVPHLLAVESSFVSGFAKLQVVGNVGDISRDGSERVRSALEKIGHPVPNQRVIVSVTPADVQKSGNHFDLPVAISLLQLMADQPWIMDPGRWLFAGELALDGSLRGARGGVAFATIALKRGLSGIVVPEGNLRELTLMRKLNSKRFSGLQVLGFRHLDHVREWLQTGSEQHVRTTSNCLVALPETAPQGKCFDDMFLTPHLKQLAAAIGTGRHSCLLRGSPGSGKTMFAERIPSIMPEMDPEEHLQALSVQTAASSTVSTTILAGRPPFRAPHHHASAASLLGTIERPGELSLAHGGVLFLDEFPEFRRDLIESLREPLETGWVQVSRAKQSINWCSKVTLIAAANNCPCGWFGSTRRKCGCAMARIRAYRDKLSGPILERIDLHVDMPDAATSPTELFSLTSNQSTTEDIRTIVKRASERARQRNVQHGTVFNRDLPSHGLLDACVLKPKILDATLEELAPRQPLGHRSLVRLLRVARSFADIDDSDPVEPIHIHRAWQVHAVGSAILRGDRFLGL